ncbi:ClpP/crotonase-like domain-containing protein [Talaromyces proteolyticus]|uniref:ClpP/crotonase-like domain-containing protein n=1 Tax=Talaromyces proteolyticus TaxID=1131652 RepID=A0AAD4Q366_9EURO|nr:ClpP/crotonase-like domain-containing protein [Talaromyces proteolyticus]KAH8701093.1 ClpP/crotonase-like domain-containing protein [Talaromyces proteolyticus]
MDELTLEYRQNKAIITLNNPQKLNALTLEQYYLLASYLREAAKRPDIHITVLTGTGRFFSAGIDLKWTKAKESTPGNAAPEELHPRHAATNSLAHIPDVTEAFYNHPNILITVLNGPVVGLSAALVAYSDFVYATPHTYLLAPFTTLGIAAEGGSTAIFIQRLGVAKANEALLLSKRISGAELVQAGFVNAVFETGEDGGGGGEQGILGQVLEVVDREFARLKIASVLENKRLMRGQFVPNLAAQTLKETLAVVASVEGVIAQRKKGRL